MVRETRRAVTELGMAGVALFVGPTVQPPDKACFEGLYRVCEELGAAVWVHPCRPQFYSDYDAYKVRRNRERSTAARPGLVALLDRVIVCSSRVSGRLRENGPRNEGVVLSIVDQAGSSI